MIPSIPARSGLTVRRDLVHGALAVAVILAWVLAVEPALAQGQDPFAWANTKISGVRQTALTFLNTLGFFALAACVAVGMLKKQGWPFAWAGAIGGGLLLVNGYQSFEAWFRSA